VVLALPAKAVATAMPNAKPVWFVSMTSALIMVKRARWMCVNSRIPALAGCHPGIGVIAVIPTVIPALSARVIATATLNANPV